MLEKLISFSLKNKLLVLLAVGGLAVWGVISLQSIAIDAVPDITNNQVQIVTNCPTLAAEEVEQYITFPVEALMANLPEVEDVRSISRYGLSVVTVVFSEKSDGMKARQLVAEQIQLAKAQIPSELGVPQMMPITTGLGEIYQYILVVDSAHADRYDATELRTIQDWIVKRQLTGVPGVIETSSFGGYVKEYEVALKPEKMAATGISVNELMAALEANNASSGGGYIESDNGAFYLRTEGKVARAEDIAKIVVRSEGNVPILVGDLAEVRIGHPLRYGAMTMDGKGEVVGGITLMLKGANSTQAVENVKTRIAQIQKGLPEGVDIYPYLDRSKLVGKTISTVAKNLIEGGLIVILVLILFLGDLRAGLVVASVIPLAMLFTLIMMNQFGVSANLMSLGAIDFGIVVDGAVIIVEGILFYLHKNYMNQQLTAEHINDAVHTATKRIYNSSTFGVLVILIVFVPLFMLQGIEGKMFGPMARTVSFAIIGALLLSLTYVPAMSALVLSKKIKHENKYTRGMVAFFQKIYRPALDFTIHRPRLVVGMAAVGFAVSVVVFSRMGSEFIPTLEEGDLAMQMSVEPGSSLSHSIATTTEAERILKSQFPEVLHVVSKIGTAEVPTDPMAIEDADIMIVLKEREEWTSATNREDLIEKMKTALEPVTDASFEFTQPIQLRFNELMTGAKTDVSVKIFGEDMELLKAKADEAAALIADVEGAADVKVEQTEGLRQLKIRVDRDLMAIYGCNVEDVNRAVQVANGGRTVGAVYENERRFDLVVRHEPEDRLHFSPHRIFVPGTGGRQVPLSALTTTVEDKGPMQISREDAKRRINIGINTRNRDVASIVADIQQRLDSQMDLPPGYFISYGGQFENLNHAIGRLKIAVPIALGLILVVLFMALGSLRDAAVIFMAIPLATVGGIWALVIRDMPFSISAGIGFIALFGVAVLNGLVLINEFKRLQNEENLPLRERIFAGAASRLRPVLMTAMVASFGFLPMALSTGNGAEVQKPLATVVIGGLVTSTLLTLLVVPAIYYLAERFRRVHPNAMAGLALVAALSVGISADAQQSVSRSEVIQMALKNRSEMNIARLRSEEWQMRQKDNYRIDPLAMDLQYGQINFPGNDYNVQVMQDLGNPFAIGRAKQWSATGSQMAEALLDRTEKEVTYRAEAAYEQWLHAAHVLSRAAQWSEQTEKLSAVVRDQLRLGAISSVEAQLAEQTALVFRKKHANALVAEGRARQFLSYVTGLPADRLTAPEPFIPLVPEPTVMVDPLLALPLRKEEEMQAARTRWLQAQRMPSGGIGAFNQSLDGVRSFSGVMIGLRVPLFAGGVCKEIDYSQLQSRQLAETRMDFEKQLESERSATEQEIMALSQMLSAYPSDFLEICSKNMKSSISLTETGQMDFVEWALLMQSLPESESAFYQLLLDHNLAVIKSKYLTLKN